MNTEFHNLTVAERREEIGGDATSLTFAIPAGLETHFQWQAGQHLPLRFVVDGQEHRRCYTISNPPGAPLRITVKRVTGGVISNYVADRLAVGDTIEAQLPLGRFALKPGNMKRRTHYFFGAGSGITPLFSMINAVLLSEPHSVAHLIYGNKNAKSIIFREELGALSAAHPGRFTLRHVLSSPSVWTWSSPWRNGRVDAETIAAAITETPPVAQDVQYWICGPGEMNKSTRSALLGLDVPDNRIHLESFGGAATIDTSVEGIAATAFITLNGAAHTVSVASGQTILEAMLAAGLMPNFSCQSGVCGSCKANLKKGRVHMRAQMALDDQEVAAGGILTCQSVAETDTIAIELP
ncbi:ferredoxin--NADP reductase [Ruegeria lacuscaerulensis]|uniref:ferredoxin--NADP reductase n=1 Tax=Ruegeria lacuscaerulensis TaxID=55218 RepID=UPI00147DE834|nr:ferredoxin--NADP reductase [Ruegeria lacuscaerulensis]